MVYWFVNVFVHQYVDDFIQQSFHHHKQLWQVGRSHLEKNGLIDLAISQHFKFLVFHIFLPKCQMTSGPRDPLSSSLITWLTIQKKIAEINMKERMSENKMFIYKQYSFFCRY